MGEWCGSCISIEKRDAYDPSSTGYDVHDWRGGDYTRTHRDQLIINAMRGLMGLGKIVLFDDLCKTADDREDLHQAAGPQRCGDSHLHRARHRFCRDRRAQ